MEKTFAVLSNNLVSNIIIAESKEIAEQIVGFTCVEYTSENPAGIGDTYDSENNIFIKPAVTE